MSQASGTFSRLTFMEHGKNFREMLQRCNFTIFSCKINPLYSSFLTDELVNVIPFTVIQLHKPMYGMCNHAVGIELMRPGNKVTHTDNSECSGLIGGQSNTLDNVWGLRKKPALANGHLLPSIQHSIP